MGQLRQPWANYGP